MKIVNLYVKEYANANEVTFMHDGKVYYKKVLDIDQSPEEYIDWVTALYSAMNLKVERGYEN